MNLLQMTCTNHHAINLLVKANQQQTILQLESTPPPPPRIIN